MHDSVPRRIVGIIPARGGSKRLPRKNIAPVLGRPMLYYTVKASLEAELVHRTFVTTEDEETAHAAAESGAEIIPRPAELAGETSTTEAALEHAVHHLGETLDYRPEIIALLQPTSPVRKKGDIDAAIRKMLDTGADSLLSVNNFPAFFWHEDGRGFYQSHDYDYAERPFHHNMKKYRENGSIYIMHVDKLMETHSRLAGKITIYEMDSVFSLEVDTPSQLEVVRAVMKTNKECIK